MATKPMVGVSGQAWQAANADDNCGTGAGGFQPGNTCAKGDGSGGEAPLNRVQRPPLPRKETASFDAAAWAAKPVPDRVKEWSAMGQAKRDEIADAANSVPARRKELLAPLGERPAPTGDAKADAKARVAQASEHVTRYAAAKIEKQAGRYADLLGEAGIEGEQAATLVAHATDELLAQEMEGMRRQLGDHGISHIGGNIERGLSILDAVPGDHTPQDRLQIVISNIYHDTGYMTGPSRTFLDEGHPRWSAEHYNNEVKPMVKAALGSRVANEIEHDIRTHADTSINWQEDAAGSAVRVADNTGLFQRDKLPPLFRHIPANIETLSRLSRKEITLPDAQKEMRARIEASDYPAPVKAALAKAADEVGPMTGKFTLGMMGGNIEAVNWKDGHVEVTLREDKLLTQLHKIGDFGQRQFGKFAESYGQDPEAFKNSLEFTFRDRAGNPLLSSRVVKGAANSRVGVSGHYWTLANGDGQPCGDSFIAADKTCQVGVTKESRVSAAASRFRPREEVRFSPTLKGPNGAELTAYEWKWMPEEYVKKNGDDGVRRVSNWEEAEESTDTGRNIVHQFVVKTADGQNHLVSSESVPQMLGFVAKGQGTRLPSLVSGAKTLAKIQMKIAVTEAQHAENERIEKEVKALHLPDITSYPAIREVGSDKGKPYGTVWKMDDAEVLEHAHRKGQTEVLPTRISQERRETLEWVWRTNRQKERGWERPREDLRSLRMRAKRQEAKLNAITAPAANSRVSVGGYVWQPLEVANAGGFDEVEHPRDDAGRFAEKGGAGATERVRAWAAERFGSEKGKAFAEWFGDSKAVDAEGKPLKVYHGTARSTKSFDEGQPVFFTESADDASFYAKTGRAKFADEAPAPNVMPVFLSLQNPKEFSGTTDIVERSWQKDRAAGFDGYKMPNGTWVAFYPTQIKSATGNRGTFSKDDPDIGNERPDARTCPGCGRRFDAAGMREAAMGAVACPDCGKPVAQAANEGTSEGAVKGWETRRRGDHTVKDEFVKESLSADSAVFATQGHVPESLNGVPFAPVKDYDASKVPDVAVDEPPLPHLMPHEHMAAGVIVTEPDGRVWLYEPKNHWAGYQNTFSKGTQEEGMTLQQTALKELHEETGLTAEIKGYVGDWAGTQSVSRFYHGVRTGGSPTGHKGDETLAVKLVTPDDAGKILNTKRDQKILHALADKGIVARPATKPEFVPRPEPEYAGGKHWSETPGPAHGWSEPKVGTSGHTWQPQPKPVAPQPKKPMLWTDWLKQFGNEFVEEDHPRDEAGRFAPKRPEFQTSNPKQKAENEAALDKVEQFFKTGDKASLVALTKHPSPKVAAYAKAHADWSGGKAAPAAPKPAALPPAPTSGSSNPQQVAQNQAAVAEAQAAHKAGDAAALAKLAAHPSPKVAGYAKALAASLPGSPAPAPSAPVAAPEPPEAAVMPSKPPKAASGQQAGGNPAPEASPDSPQAKAAAALRLAVAEKLGTTPDKVRETARGSGHYKDAAAVKARVGLESALLEHGLAVQDAGVEVAKLVDEEANAAWLAKITEGDAAKNAKFLANVPAHDLSVLSKVTWDTKPHGGLACCDMHARTILMGSNSTNSGDSRHELGHAVHGYWLQGGGPMAQRVAELHEEAMAKFKADPAAAGMKEAQKLGKKIDHEYAETHWGVAGSRSLDNAKEDAAEHFRLYQREVYRELKEGKAGAVAQYRERHPGWAALWDAHYSAALAAL